MNNTSFKSKIVNHFFFHWKMYSLLSLKASLLINLHGILVIEFYYWSNLKNIKIQELEILITYANSLTLWGGITQIWSC